MSLIENLNWRYATKRMNGKTVPPEKVDYVLEAARVAPSSSGLQPYEMLKNVRQLAHDQNQITECSHLLVFAAWDHYSNERIGNVLRSTVRERGLPDNVIEGYQKKFGVFTNPWATHGTKRTLQDKLISPSAFRWLQPLNKV